MTNALAIASAALAVFTLLAGSAVTFGTGKLEMILSISGIFLTLYEIFARRAVSATAPRHGAQTDPGPFSFPIEKGLLGGLFGGAMAAPIIALAFHYLLLDAGPQFKRLEIVPPPEMQIITEIFLASIAIGAIVGILTLGLAETFRHWHRQAPATGLIFNAMTGAILGGVLAGLICGPLGTLYFGQKPLPFLGPSIMLLGALPAIGIITFAIVTYDNNPLDRRSFRNFLLAMAATGLVAAILYVGISSFTPEIMALVQHYILPGKRIGLLTGGLYYGAFIGASLGLVVGLTMIFIGKRI